MAAKLRLIVGCVNKKTAISFYACVKKPRLFKGAASHTGRKCTASTAKARGLQVQTGTKGLTMYFQGESWDGAAGQSLHRANWGIDRER